MCNDCGIKGCFSLDDGIHYKGFVEETIVMGQAHDVKGANTYSGLKGSSRVPAAVSLACDIDPDHSG